MSSSDFLSRWSRRKLEARKADAADAAGPTPRPETAGDPAPPGTGEGLACGPEGAALSPEAIAALPRIEDLTADTDLSQFLRAGVPSLLRQAALRRMWSLDPAIRDFVGEARDYSYDWNVPGGVPVSGPLAPSEDAVAEFDRMFGRPQQAAGPGSPGALPNDPGPEPGTGGRQANEADEADDQAGAAPPEEAGEGLKSGQPEAAKLSPAAFRESALPEASNADRSRVPAFGEPRTDGEIAPRERVQAEPRPRRHGSAMPKEGAP